MPSSISDFFIDFLFVSFFQFVSKLLCYSKLFVKIIHVSQFIKLSKVNIIRMIISIIQLSSKCPNNLISIKA